MQPLRAPPIGAELEDTSFLSTTVMPLAKNIATMLVTGYVLLASDVLAVMYGSRKIYRNLMYASLACHSVLALIGLYLTFVVARYEPNWETTHMRFIYVATGSVVLGSLLWTIAVWPVFHVWTIPIGLAFLFFIFSAISLVPGKKKTKPE